MLSTGGCQPGTILAILARASGPCSGNAASGYPNCLALWKGQLCERAEGSLLSTLGCGIMPRVAMAPWDLSLNWICP